MTKLLIVEYHLTDIFLTYAFLLVTTAVVTNINEVQNFPKYVPLPGVQKLLLPIAPFPASPFY